MPLPRLIVVTFMLASSVACSSDTGTSQDTRTLSPPDQPAWFRQARAIDLTGDGAVDSAVVEARGRRSDSLQVRILSVVGGQVLFAQGWSSSYQLANLDSLRQRPPGSDTSMRAALTEILEDIRVTPLDTSYLRDFPGDTNALRMARRGPVQSITVAYGYETTIAVVWDPDAKRFLVAHSCC